MAKQTRKWNPGDAANTFVRVILSDAGTLLGGLTETEWKTTLDWFEGRCAYTDDVLRKDQVGRDHAIPMNRKHCGLHLFGNVLPATREANRRKAGKHYRDFIDDRGRLERIEEFVRSTGYWERVLVFGKVLQEVNGGLVVDLLGHEVQHDHGRSSATAQFPEAFGAVVPLAPQVRAQSSTYPPLQTREHVRGLTETEVAAPAQQIRL